MFKSFTTCCCLSLFVAVAGAQAPKETAEHASTEMAAPASDTDLQKRRTALRAALALQRDGPDQPVLSAQAERQLTDQERALLRQQLRQQGR